jgi:hypothetical protein
MTCLRSSPRICVVLVKHTVVLLGRSITRLILTIDSLCSLFVTRLVLSAFVAHNTLIQGTAGRWPRHSGLTAMLAALILLSL